MSQFLTVTQIPEEKFRRFSRFPYVAATKIDERFNNVYDQSGNQMHSKKSKIKFLNSSRTNNRSREVTFDLQEKPDIISDMFETHTKVRICPEEEEVLVQQIDVNEPETDLEELVIGHGKVDQNKNSFLKLKEKYLAESREKEKKFAKSKEEKLKELNDIKHGMSDWCFISYELPEAPKPVHRKGFYSVPTSGMDILKSDETADISGKEDVLNGVGKNKTKNGVEQIGNQGDSGNIGRFYNHSLLELIDFGQPIPKSEDKIVHAKKKPCRLVRNTRFGGDTKVTAYRPSTTMDKFRKDKLEMIKENPADCLDLEEGNRIWAEVNTIINNSVDKRKRMNQWLNRKDSSVSMVPDQHTGRTNHLNYSVELRPQLGSRNESIAGSTKERIGPNETEMANSVTKDENRIIGSKGIEEKDIGAKSLPMETRFRRFKHENFFAEEDIKTKDHIRLIFRESPKSNVRFNTEFGAAVETGDCVIDHSALNNMSQKSGAGKVQLIYPSSGQCNTGPEIHLPTEGACSGKQVTMTTTLPRITPVGTPLPTGITQPPPRSHSSASMYVPYPPKELSSSFDYLRIPGRINPLAPPPPRRRINWSWETTDQHHENEKRRLLMQKREHTRYHSAWSKAFYGAPAEKEAYRRHFREVLKQQMADKNTMEKTEFKEKIRETEQAISYDRECRSNDANEYHRRHSYLMQYRDGNKKQMEDRWATTRYNRELENRIDRERLRYNPINWSCSLK